MFSRSSRTKKRVAGATTVTVIKPEEKKVSVVKPVLDLSKAKITIIKPDTGLEVTVEEENEGESE